MKSSVLHAHVSDKARILESIMQYGRAALAIRYNSYTILHYIGVSFCTRSILYLHASLRLRKPLLRPSQTRGVDFLTQMGDGQ